MLRTHKDHGRKYCCSYGGKKFYDRMICLQSKKRYCAFKELLAIFKIKIVFVEISAGVVRKEIKITFERKKSSVR